MKILFIILDGLGDSPIKDLKDKTPLEKAKTPNLDYLVQNGNCGLIKPFYTMALPTSEESHFSLFGYNPKIYGIRRGIFTAQGAGIKLKKGDVALRGNFATVDKNLNIIDRRSGRIEKTETLINSLNRIKINNVKILVKQAGQHRIAVVLRGKNLSSKVSDGDPHYSKLGKKARRILSLDKNSKSVFTARALNEFLEESHKVLKNHPFNKKRQKSGFPPANYILIRGASSIRKIPSFKQKYGFNACCIAGKPLYKQIAGSLGMKLINVKGANGLVSTNLKGKIQAAKKSLRKYNFVFLHIKATDSLAEDGDFLGKKRFIEKIDRNIKPLLDLKNTLIVVTADHSTCSKLKRHCKNPIPVLIYKPGIRLGKYRVEEFSEKACKKGKLGRIKQINLMSKVLKLAEAE